MTRLRSNRELGARVMRQGMGDPSCQGARAFIRAGRGTRAIADAGNQAAISADHLEGILAGLSLSDVGGAGRRRADGLNGHLRFLRSPRNPYWAG